MKPFGIRVFQPLWLVLPLLPMTAFLTPIFSLGLLGIGLLTLYFLPVLVVIYAFLFLTVVLPSFMLPLLQAAALFLFFAYCIWVAYQCNRYFLKSQTRFSLHQVILVYALLLTPVLTVYAVYAGVPASDVYPFRALKAQQSLVQKIKTYHYRSRIFDSEYFVKIQYEGDFVVQAVEELELQPYSVEEIAWRFWYGVIVWWQPRKTEDSAAYRSEGFNFFGRGKDGEHYFLYDMPSRKICYIWYKSHF